MGIGDFLKPLGMLAYLLVLLTFLFGLFRWNFKVHKKLGIAAVILATLHAILVLVYVFPDVF